MIRNFYFFVSISMGILTSLGSCSSLKKSSDGDTHAVKILSYNIRNARGMDDVVDFDRVANVISRIDADCVALQELDSATQRSNGLVVLDELARRTGMFAAYNASIDYQGGKYGIGILTKEKPVRKKSIPLPGSEEMRSLLMVELKDYVLCCTHWSLRQPDRLASVPLIDSAAKEFAGKPVFLAGDLNATHPSQEIYNLSIDWLMLNDAAKPTIPSAAPNRCIDYIMVRKNPAYSFDVLQTEVEEEPMASDHLPVWVNLVFKKLL